MMTQAILDFIAAPRPSELEPLALAIFSEQFARIEAYRRYCLSMQASPATVRSLFDIPLVSTAAFKHTILSAQPQSAERVFVTSGTSRGEATRGRHFVSDLALYRASAVAHMRRMLFPEGRRMPLLALHPTADRLPESSLSQMLTWAFEAFGAADSCCCATQRGVDVEAAARFLANTRSQGEPVGILGTTAAFAVLFDFLRQSGSRLRLAAGSRLMDTGGAKGQAIPMSSEELTAAAHDYLGIASELVINEYGMTELCSQLYDATPFNTPYLRPQAARVKLPPPWLHVSARDPVTMRPVPPGAPGLLCFFDLANAGSISALMTEDLGTVLADGTVQIHGRALAADARGCALGIEQFAAAEVRLSGAASVQAGVADGAGTADSAAIHAIAARMPSGAHDVAARIRTAGVIADACRLWRQPDYPLRREMIAATALAGGQSEPLLDASLDALLARFDTRHLLSLAEALPPSDCLFGFVMPGNAPGAGLHELAQALIAGARAIVKSASAQPFFFPAFARTIAQLDSHLAQRLAVCTWDRQQSECTAALAQVCDMVAAFGNDETMALLAVSLGRKLIDFGARLSIGIVTREGLADRALSAAIARDVALFDQRGCLSMHHLFIEAEVARARDMARQIAVALAALHRTLPPARPDVSTAASARAVREDCLWRMIGNNGAELWSSEELDWAVLFDPAGKLNASPLCRTLRVSVLSQLDELETRLAAGPGIEGVALADPGQRLARFHAVLRQRGASYFCRPGELQSPPPDWPHGGGRFLARLQSISRLSCAYE